MKKSIRVISIIGVFVLLLLFSTACNVSYGRQDYDGYPIEYQFQTLNRNTSNYNSLNDLPSELRNVVRDNLKKRYEDINSELWNDFEDYISRMYSGSLEYRFLIGGEIYVIYYILLYSDYYVYKVSNSELIVIINDDDNPSDFLVKDNSLLYSTKNGYKETNVLTKETGNISQKAFDEEYYKYVPAPSKLPDGNSYQKDFPTLYKNTTENPTTDGSCHGWRTSWFYYKNEYYFISSINSTLCKYNLETDTYTRLSRMGYRPEACFLHDDYIYYIYGEEGYGFFDALANHNPKIVSKKVHMPKYRL